MCLFKPLTFYCTTCQCWPVCQFWLVHNYQFNPIGNKGSKIFEIFLFLIVHQYGSKLTGKKQIGSNFLIGPDYAGRA